MKNAKYLFCSHCTLYRSLTDVAILEIFLKAHQLKGDYLHFKKKKKDIPNLRKIIGRLEYD